MFLTAYIALVLVAALPLARTLSKGRGGGPGVMFLHRLYRDFAYIVAAVIAIIVFETALTISLQNYWFGELGQRYRYWLALGLRSGIFLTLLVSVGAFVGYNLRVLCRPLPAVPRTAPWFAALFLAALVGIGATTLWIPLLGYFGATASGTSDPVFSKDISFYLLVLPWYDAVVAIMITVLVMTITLWALMGFAFYPNSGRPWHQPAYRLGSSTRRSLRVIESDDADSWPQNELIWRGWLRQGVALAMLLCISMGISRFLGRYHLVINGHSTVVAGGSYADIYFWIPAYDVIMVCWFVAAFILALAVAMPRFLTWLVTRPSYWVLPCGLFAILYLGAVIVPPTVEQVYVGPNQITLEQPFLKRSIAGTREAYNLDGSTVEEREFAVSAVPLTRQDLDKNAATLKDARIWDWRALEPQLQQIQGLRPYYSFAGVDIDRYAIDGAERQVMITARELNLDKLPDQAKVWVNLALKYTHGYGAVAVPVNEMDSRGNPVLWAHDIPVKAKGNLAVVHGAIYYGALTRDRVYVRTSEKEFDFPQGQANAETIHEGKGGIPLSSFWRKLVVANERDGLRLFISGYFTPESRVLLRRNIVERVERLAPFLILDHDPSIVADGDH